MSGAERKILVLCGPTASGKSSLAEQLSTDLPLQLVSADSMLVYRGMDIGTAKPKEEDRHRWSLIDRVDPGQSYSAGDFVRDAATEIENAWQRGRVPCLTGGTGLYLRALFEGLAEIPPIPADLRQAIERMSAEERIQSLQHEDPLAAARIDLKNPRRVSRALEVIRHTRQSLVGWQAEGKRSAFADVPRLAYCLSPDPKVLLKRIQQRAEEALRAGWLEETEKLAARHGEAALRSTGAIGYGELLDVLAGRISLSAATELIMVRTAQYARRQRTWFRRESSLIWIESGTPEGIRDRIESFLA